MTNDNIDNLVSMGFDPESARSALTKANNDVIMAVGLLTGDIEDQVSQSQQQPPPPSYDIAPLTGPSENIPIGPLDDEIRAKINDRTTTSEPLKEYNPMANKYSIYDDIPRWQKEDNRKAILPVLPDLMESYVAPLVMILGSIPASRNLLLKHPYFSYSFKPNWWSKEKVLESSLFPMELQRLLAFMDVSSMRAFSSTFNLTMATNKLIDEAFESICDYINFFMKIILERFSRINSDFAVPLEELFLFKIVHENQKQDYFIIPIQNENLSNNLYQTVHGLFWGANLERFGHDNIFSIPDLLTFCIDTDGEAIPNGGFDLEETFYPQIYTKEHEHIIGRQHQQMLELSNQYRQYEKAIYDTKLFQGKRISSILGMSGNYLQSLGEGMQSESKADNKISEGDKVAAAGQTIEMIKDQIVKVAEELGANNEGIIERMKRLKHGLYNPAVLLEDENLEPWILSGVVISSTDYYYKEAEKWVHVTIDPETCKDFRIETTDFEDIQKTVKAVTGVDFDNTLILTYVRQSLTEITDFQPLNPTLQDFIDEDNKNLEEVLKAAAFEPSHIADPINE